MFSYSKKIFSSFFIITLTLTTLTCKKSPNEPNWFDKFLFTFEDASCTEAWFNLKLNNLSKPVLVNVYKDNSFDKTFNIYASDDTTFYIENLLPKKSYEVYVEVKPANDRLYRSSKLQITTMDTTSHDFEFQVFTFGECGNSVLFDVAIIDENDIWAVGEIFVRDSLGRCDPNSYNAVHWDGTKWELKRIGGEGGWACRTIFAFSANDIWFEGKIHWNGRRYTVYKTGWPYLPNGDGWRVNKMWGTSSSDLYAVGEYGNIAHWDGVRWRKIEANLPNINLSEYNLHSIAGGFPTGEIFIGGKHINYYLSPIFRLKNGKILDTVGLPVNTRLSSLTRGGNFLILEMADMNFYGKNIKTKSNFKRLARSGTWYVTDIAANDINDIVTVAHNYEIFHYNGMNAKRIYFDYSYSGDVLNGVDIKRDLIVAVGLRYDGVYNVKGIVMIGKRKN